MEGKSNFNTYVTIMKAAGQEIAFIHKAEVIVRLINELEESVLKSQNSKIRSAYIAYIHGIEPDCLTAYLNFIQGLKKQQPL